MDIIEDIPLDDYNNEAYDNEAYEDDTAFNDNTYDSIPGSKLASLHRELVQGKIRDLEKKFGTSIPTTEYDRFRISGKDLQLEKSNGQYVSLTNSRSGKFLESSGIHNRLGASLARELLNIETPKKEKEQARKILDKTVDIKMEELTTDQKIKTIEEVLPISIEEVLPISIGVNTDLNMREFLGIDKALTRIKGELQNNAAKLSELDKHTKKSRILNTTMSFVNGSKVV